MTEEEWLADPSTGPLRPLLAGRFSDRKCRLFASRLAHCLLEQLDAPGPGSQIGGAAAGKRRWEAMKVAEAAVRDIERLARGDAGARRNLELAAFGLDRLLPDCPELVQGVRDVIRYAIGSPQAVMELPGQSADMYWEFFGNPFRQVAFDPRWRTADAVGLARAIYDDRRFDRLPILADALMDAGCESEAVLMHCRSDRWHARGCWVIDEVLGKL